MGYTSRDRDRGRRTVTAATVIGSVGALTATGWLMGAAASDFAAQQQPAGSDQAGDGRPTAKQPRPGRRPVRPYVTRVTIRYVTAAGSTTSAPGPGATVVPAASTSSGSSTSSSSSTSSGPSDSSGTSSGPGPAPEPAPAPAPSSGS